jgi:hypothetical protein
MKSLPIKIIIDKLNGKIIHGIDTLIITDIVTRYRSIRQNFLMFDIYHDNDINVLINAGCPYCAIITDKPLNVEMLSDNITVMQVADINTAYWKTY